MLRANEQCLQAWLAAWLEQRGLAVNDIAHRALHPGGPKILAAVQAALGFPDAALADSWQILANYGNMSSPTVLFIKQQKLEKRVTGPVVSLGFWPWFWSWKPPCLSGRNRVLTHRQISRNALASGSCQPK